jgi:hypothetical protein
MPSFHKLNQGIYDKSQKQGNGKGQNNHSGYLEYRSGNNKGNKSNQKEVSPAGIKTFEPVFHGT